MRRCFVLFLLLFAGVAFAQDEAYLARAKADIALILPQLGLGGEDTDALTPLKYTTKDWRPAAGTDPIDAVWCVPEGVKEDPSGKKVALLITFHGDGGNASGQAGAVARVSTAEDPVFVASVGWQNGERSLRGGDVPGFVAQVREMTAAIAAAYPIDATRVSMHGFSAGCTVTEFFLAEEWEKSPATMDIRAAFFSSKAFDPAKKYPPIPMIQTVGEKEDNFYGRDQRAYIRQYCCAARKAGLAVTYHEIPGRGHELAPRVLQIIRDHIQAFGGPGCDVYRAARGTQEPPEALPFASEDPLVSELISLCRAEDWAGALARAQAIDADKEIKSKDKKEAKKFPKEMEKYAKKALPELEKKIEDAMKAEAFPPGWVVKRMKALIAAYGAETWVSNRNYNALLGKLENEFEPAKRERAREEALCNAESLEAQAGKWGDAKIAYTDLASRKEEDNGTSVWPKAAAYRLTWWVD